MKSIERLLELAGIHLGENQADDILDIRSELVNLLTFTTNSSSMHIKEMVKSLSDDDLKKEAHAIQVVATKIAKAAESLRKV